MEHQPGRATDGFVRPSDLVALALVAEAASALAHHLLGLQYNAMLVMFVVTWVASAAKRLSDFRRGQSSADGQSGGVLPRVVVGSGLWAVLIFLLHKYPTSFIWTPRELPLAIHGLGVLLACLTVLRRPRQTANDGALPETHLPPRLAVDAQILALAMLLMSGSLVVGLMVSVWLVYLHGESRWRLWQPRPVEKRHDEPAMATSE